MAEIFNLSNLCRCCHADGQFKRLDVAYDFVSGSEIYANLIHDLFGLYMRVPPAEYSYNICDACIRELRTAARFKMQIMECERKFTEYCGNEQFLCMNTVNIKIEYNDENADDTVNSETQVQKDINISFTDEKDNDDSNNFKSQLQKYINTNTSHMDDNDLRDKEVIEQLDESEFEDVEEDPFASNETDKEYVREKSNSGSASSSSSSESSDEPRITQISERRGIRGGNRGRGIKARERSGRGRSLVRQESTSDHVDDWQIRDFSPSAPNLSEPSYMPVDSTGFDCSQYFMQYIDNDLVALIVSKTNQTYTLRTGKSLGLNERECKIFIGITMLMSCLNYPYIRMYWEGKWRISIVADSMARNRYFLLKTSLKLVFDDDISQEQRTQDKMWKVRPIIGKVLQGCRKQVRDQHLSIDEKIIPFSGRCGIKRYCPDKPNPVGLKAFVLANPDGMVCDFTVYQGQTTFPDENADFSLAESAVLNMTRSLVPGHILYFDRYFTSLRLVEELNRRGFKCVGALMKNRIPVTLKNVLPEDREMKRKGRGCSSVYVNTESTVAVTKWFDNKPVILMSSIYGSEPTDDCLRWSKQKKQYIHIQRPFAVKMYSNKMRGVDLADRILALCPSSARTNKWTIRFFCHMLDLSASNAWIQFRKDELNKGIPLKRVQSLRQWKMQLAETLIEENTYYEDILEEEYDSKPETRKRGRPAVVPIPSKIRRLHGALHMPTLERVPRRCRLPGCSKITTAKCNTCMVSLCLTSSRNCFQMFHE